MDMDTTQWVDMRRDPMFEPENLREVQRGFNHFMDEIEKFFVEKSGTTPEVANAMYMKDVAQWCVQNDAQGLSVPVLAGYTEYFVMGMDTVFGMFIKEIEKAKSEVVRTIKVEW